MSAFQAIALHDFSTNVKGELPFHTDDLLIITSKDIGSGWWEAKNSEGTIGLIPKSYVRLKSEASQKYHTVSPQRSTSSSSSSTPSVCLPPRPPPKPARCFFPASSASLGGGSSCNNYNNNNDDDNIKQELTRESEDWSSADEDVPSSSQGVRPTEQLDDAYEFDDDDDDDEEDEEEEFKSSKLVGLMTGSADTYLFESNPSLPSEDVPKVFITQSREGSVWLPPISSISCRLGAPRKEKKFHGMKSFTTYQVIPSSTSVPVHRRYKHFDWLHGQLVRKFITLVIPPLPCKQISGRFEEEFITVRLKQLESWLTRMCHHPVVSQSDVFRLFVECRDTEEWKSGKRLAERDKFRGAFFYYTVQPPAILLDPISVELRLDKFERFIRCMDDSIKHLLGVCSKVGNCYKCKFRKEFCKLGKSFDDLSKSFELDSRSESKALSSAMSYTGKTYSEVGMLFGVQSSRDMDFLVESLLEYKGILSVFPDVLLVQRSTTNKIQETAGQLSRQDVNRVQGRANVITYTLLAEMNHFQVNRVSDFSRIMQNYLLVQIDFFKQITTKLEQALKLY